MSIVSGEFQMIENPTGFFAKSERAVYTMLFGLSAHSVFEGLAIGLQDVSSKLWLLAGTGRGSLMIFFGCASQKLLHSRRLNNLT